MSANKSPVATTSQKNLSSLISISLFASAFASNTYAETAQITEYLAPDAKSTPLQLAIDKNSNIWFGEYATGNVVRLSKGVMQSFSINPAAGPMNMWASPIDGSIWLSAIGNYIVRITPKGKVITYPIPTAQSMPMGTTGDSRGNIWFSEELGNKIGVVRTSGYIDEYSIPTTASKPTGLTVDQYDNIWFAESATDKIGVLRNNGVFNEYTLPAGSKPMGINYSPKQKSQSLIWFTSSSANQIGSITQAGDITLYNVPTASSTPQMIMEDALGNVWFTEMMGNKIGRLTADHTSIIEYTTPTPNSGPMGLAVNPLDNSVWFAETTGNNIGQLILSAH